MGREELEREWRERIEYFLDRSRHTYLRSAWKLYQWHIGRLNRWLFDY